MMVIRNILYAMEVEEDIIQYFLKIAVNLEHALIKVIYFFLLCIDTIFNLIYHYFRYIVFLKLTHPHKKNQRQHKYLHQLLRQHTHLDLIDQKEDHLLQRFEEIHKDLFKYSIL